MTKLCECGCGEPAPISKVNRPERGYKKGEPQRFVIGHSRRGRSHTPEVRARIVEALRNRVVSDTTRARLSQAKRGSANPMWKGGARVDKGRRVVQVGSDHPMANSSGWVYEHRLVAAAAIGRFLRPDEYVHHIDLDPLNNTPENLVIVTPGQHSRIHRLLDWHGGDPVAVVKQVLAEEVV